jgi:hypothetical protein
VVTCVYHECALQFFDDHTEVAADGTVLYKLWRVRGKVMPPVTIELKSVVRWDLLFRRVPTTGTQLLDLRYAAREDIMANPTGVDTVPQLTAEREALHHVSASVCHWQRSLPFHVAVRASPVVCRPLSPGRFKLY